MKRKTPDAKTLEAVKQALGNTLHQQLGMSLERALGEKEEAEHQKPEHR